MIAQWGPGHWTWQESQVSLEARRRRERRRANLILSVPGATVGVVVLVVVAVASVWWAGLAAGVVVGVLLSLVVRHRMLPGLLGGLGAQLMDPSDHPRVVNLVEGLCLQMGLRAPTLWMVEGEVPDALALAGVGTEALVLTSAISKLSRLELEALFAHELSHLRRADAAPTTAAAFVFGRLRPAWVTAVGCGGADGLELREVEADLAGLGVTRYPPALVSVMAAWGHRAAEQAPWSTWAAAALSELWVLPLGGRDASSETRPRLDRRLDLVAEL